MPWACDYSNGIIPPTVYGYGLHTTMHPTPIYETIFAVLCFLFLLQLRKKELPTGEVFTIYLILAGLGRFIVEFIRFNERLLFGLSEAQLISVVMIIIGISGYVLISKYIKTNK